MMLQDIGKDRYNNHWEYLTPENEDRMIAFRGNELMMRRAVPGDAASEPIALPTWNKMTATKSNATYLFSIDNERYFLYLPGIESALDGFDFVPATAFRGMRNRDLSFACSIASHLWGWYSDNRFCGRCGTPTQLDTKERMVRCPLCGNLIYPKICPGVIVGIIHDGKLLMTRYTGRPYTAHALVAGFTEIGEPIEDTVRREVREEVGLEVKNITFYKSQPWPPSSSVLCGFFAELDGDIAITVDHEELAEAGWFSPEDVPHVDDHYSLTREMMCFFHDNYQHPERMIHRK